MNQIEKEQFKERFDSDRCPEARPEDFRLLAFLARGEFGKVYLVEYLGEEGRRTFYALKSQSKAAFVHENMRREALQEKKILYAVKHPFVIDAAFASGDQNNLYIVLQLAPHGNIKKYIRKMPERILKILITQLVCAIDYLHRCRVIHRDVTPSNILMGADGCIRLGDFGLAVVNNQTTFITCGNLAYKAPEEFQSKGYTDAIDWWAVGIIMYEFAFRMHPFWAEGAPAPENVARCCKGLVSYPEVFRVATPFRSAVEGFLQKQPEHRLGGINGGLQGVSDHPWFTTDFDFDSVAHSNVRIPLSSCGVIDVGHEPDWILVDKDGDTQMLGDDQDSNDFRSSL